MTDINSLLYRIIDGYIEYNGFKIFDPRGKILSLGNRVYSEYMNQNYDLLNKEELYIAICQYVGWDSTKEAKLKSIPKELEDLKLAYFENYIGRRQSNKIAIEAKFKEYEVLVSQRNTFFGFTPEGIASGAKWQVMIGRMYKGPKPLTALKYYQANSISEDSIRDIALSYEWSSYFSVSNNPFGKSAINLTEYQRQLLQWSRIYKNIYANPDAPVDIIVKDHLALDGWMIQQDRKNKAEKRKGEITKGVKPEANNVYVSVDNIQQAKEVFELNDDKAKKRLNSMMKELDEKGSLKEQEFSHYKNRK